MIVITVTNISVNMLVMIVKTFQKLRLAFRQLKAKFDAWRKNRTAKKYAEQQEEIRKIEFQNSFIGKVYKNLKFYKNIEITSE